ncbi:MAG: hypothetical protein WAL71_02475 [Terriglobales bacterium]|jgi:hypothetical protein
MFTIFGWLVAAALIVLSLVFARMLTNTYDWKLWPAIRRTKRDIREIVRQRVPNAEVFSHQSATAINPGHLSFSIRTATDKERDLLCGDPELYQQFCDALREAGYPQNTVPVVKFGIESQETVDRDYGGSWSERSQMP